MQIFNKLNKTSIGEGENIKKDDFFSFDKNYPIN